MLLAFVAGCADDPTAHEAPACDDGFALANGTCADIDECTLELDNCDARATCTNTPGGFTCACPDGWTGDGTSCAPAPCRYDYANGHGDMYTSWDATNGFTMALRSELEPGLGERAYAPFDVCIHVPHATYDDVVSIGGRPPGPGWDPVGVAEGVPFWYLSEVAIEGTPWFGVASDPSPAGGVPIGIFTESLTLKLSVSGPPDSAFSVWSSVSDPEAPPFLFSTSTSRSEAHVFTGSHAHLTWAFTKAGIYLVEATIRGTHADTGETESSAPATYRFIVE